ncbi:uncharacterized protein LOC113290718 [Papaver somniferum]|uniref:uncharacterized protein LOC113290718 n=1 Tax=Papaver somniferum TaxID=3469 RepID=UPI000E6FEFE8|nr:uncharacterized protein LOC113290718 [Papaver somniferum]
MSISETVIPYVVGADSSKDLWENTESRYARSSSTHSIQLRLKLQSTKLGSGTVSTFLSEIKKITDELFAAGSRIDDDELVVTILNGFRPDYSSLCTSISIRNPPISSKELHNLLLSEEIVVTNKQKNLITEANSKAFAATRPYAPMFRGSGRGGNSHITNDETEFLEATSFEGADEIQESNGEGMAIPHIGNVSKTTYSYSFNLNNVLLVPKSSQNLLSAHKFPSDNNCSITFDSVGFAVKDHSTGRIILQGPHKGGLYPIKFIKSTQNIAFFSNNASASIWHQRLAHPSFQVLQKVCRDMNLSSLVKTPLFCNDCHHGKSHKLPFTLSSHGAQSPLELLHMDLWGPSPPTSVAQSDIFQSSDTSSALLPTSHSTSTTLMPSTASTYTSAHTDISVQPTSTA